MLDRERLATVLGLLGSNFAGERDNAARLAIRMLKEAGLTWPQVLDGERVATAAARLLLQENEQLREELAQLRAQRRVTPNYWHLPESPEEQIEQAAQWSSVLSPWERGFVVDIADRYRLTPRQREVLDKISSKIAGVARARGLRS